MAVIPKTVVSPDWQVQLERWAAAGLIDSGAVERIRIWQLKQPGAPGAGWLILVALAFGAMLLCAGILLFVSAHWDRLSPGWRMTLVVLMVAVFHVAGASIASRYEALSVALHTVGTFALGAAIALTGQIFNLSAHWPNAILLWIAGSSAAWFLLRHWTQGAATAILIPFWFSAEFESSSIHAVATGICALSFTYLSAVRDPGDSAFRKSLVWIGVVSLLPSVVMVALPGWVQSASSQMHVVAWLLAFFGPLAFAFFLRRRAAVWNALAIGWVAGLAAVAHRQHEIPVYLWCVMGALGLVAWGARELRAERINLGMVGFGITLLAFYFSNVMNKLDRSFSLILLGFIFLGGGWLLERMRRRLVAHILQVVPQ